MAVNDVWRLSLVGSHAGTDLGICTMHIRMKTGVGTFAGAAAYLKTNLLDLVKGQQTGTFRWDSINGLLVNTTPKQSASYATGFPIAVTGAGDPLPHQSALVVTVKTAYAGRSYRGRNYWPAFSENATTSGTFTVATVNAMQQYYDDLVAALGSGGSNADYEWVVWSEKLSTGTAVTEAIVRNNPGVIRRRRIGVGA